ncbi:MAG: NAD(P)/FAD-dependent oxidoreductase [Candidatus Methylomirabilales bacterium]
MTGGGRTQVVVVGGGPAGAVAALAAARRGAEVLLLDRARFPRPKPCGQFVGPAGARLLGAHGLWEAVRGAGARPLAGMRIEVPDGSVLLGRFPGGLAASGRDSPAAFALSRESLDAALLNRARLAGVRILEGVRVLDVQAGASHVVVLALAGRRVLTLRAEWVIGADGRHSAVARALGLRRRLLRLRRFGLLADFADFPDGSRLAEVFVGRQAYCIVNPMGDGRACVGVVTDWRVEACRAGLSGLLAGQLAAFPTVARRAGGARLVGGLYGVGPLAFRRDPPGAGRTLLVGDAAGFYDPLTGEGVTAALQTGALAGALLADGLAAAAGPAEVQGVYAASRRRLLGPRWRFLALLQAVVRRPGLACSVAHFLERHPGALATLMAAVAEAVPGGSSASGPGWSFAGRHCLPGIRAREDAVP